MSRILIVEDERHLSDGLRFNFEAEGDVVEVAETGEVALEKLLAAEEQFDVMLLDVMLPGIDGFAVATRLREAGRFIPILMLTARGRSEDVLKGFAAGADDYLPKPFDLSILIARVRGLLRRRQWMEKPREPERFEFSGKVVDYDAQELRIGDRIIPLTLMETNLLRYLIQNEGRAVSRKSLLEEVWGVNEETDTRAIDNFIVRLRRYVEKEPASPKHLVTVRGVGYRFHAEPGAKS